MLEEEINFLWLNIYWFVGLGFFLVGWVCFAWCLGFAGVFWFCVVLFFKNGRPFALQGYAADHPAVFSFLLSSI